METVLARSWKEEFARAAAMRREDIVYKEKLARFIEREWEKREELRDGKKEREREDLAAFADRLASTQELVAFGTRLDMYDTETVEALMDNQEVLDTVRERLRDMLGEAYVLPDGRRVFKTEDGQRVFDEHGQEVSEETLDPSRIDDRKPKWEDFHASVKERLALEAERNALIDYQKKLDTARERLSEGHITNKQLADMKDDLAATMPDPVRRKLATELPTTDAAPHDAASQPVLPADMDTLMAQTGRAKLAP